MKYLSVQRTSSEDARRRLEEVIDAVSRGMFSPSSTIDEEPALPVSQPAKSSSRKRGRASSHGEAHPAKRAAIDVYGSRESVVNEAELSQTSLTESLATEPSPAPGSLVVCCCHCMAPTFVLTVTCVL